MPSVPIKTSANAAQIHKVTSLQEIIKKMARRAPQAEVAKALGMTQHWVSKMVNGELRRPRIATCRLLASRLNMTLDDILDLLPENG
jgi:transcriptional regulator with XRE-family HTH domain